MKNRSELIWRIACRASTCIVGEHDAQIISTDGSWYHTSTFLSRLEDEMQSGIWAVRKHYADDLVYSKLRATLM